MSRQLFGIGLGLNLFSETGVDLASILTSAGAPSGLTSAQDTAPLGSLILDNTTPALYQRTATRAALKATEPATWASISAAETELNDVSTPGSIGGVESTSFADGDRIYFQALTSGTSGVYIVTGTPGSAATLVAEADTAADWAPFGGDSELAYIRSFIGKGTAGSETPDYGASVTVVGQTDDLETAIGKLDVELAKTRKVASATAVTTTVTLDSALVDDYHVVSWDVYAHNDAGAYRRLVIDVAHDGTTTTDATDVDYSTTTLLKHGGINGFRVSADIDGTDAAQAVRLRVESTTSVDVVALRRAIF